MTSENRSRAPACQRDPAVTSLVPAAKMNGHDPYAQMRDVVAGQSVQRASYIEQPRPHYVHLPTNYC